MWLIKWGKVLPKALPKFTSLLLLKASMFWIRTRKPWPITEVHWCHFLGVFVRAKHLYLEEYTVVFEAYIVFCGTNAVGFGTMAFGSCFWGKYCNFWDYWFGNKYWCILNQYTYISGKQQYLGQILLCFGNIHYYFWLIQLYFG